VPPDLRARALNTLANLANDLDDYPRARSLYEESLALRRAAGDREATANSLLNLSWVALAQGRYHDVRRLIAEARGIFMTTGNDLALTFCQTALGDAATAEGDLETARHLHEAAFAAQVRRGDPTGIAYAEWRLGIVSSLAGDLPAARDRLHRALAAFREAGDRLGEAYALGALGQVELASGNPGEAAAAFAAALDLWRQAGRRLGMVECLEGAGDVFAAVGQPELAAHCLAAASAQRVVLATPLPPGRRPVVERATAAARAARGDHRFAAAWAEGVVMPLDQAVAAAVAAAASVESPRQGTAPASRSVVAGLTAREMEVLCEIAARKSNAEIAESLYISLRTVTTHIQNIFGKLGVNSRTAAAVFAIRHELC
jgi:DNA-binding CsgD family transcriptional regulator/tetratricopeptide (TPR) repeat protein